MNYFLTKDTNTNINLNTSSELIYSILFFKIFKIFIIMLKNPYSPSIFIIITFKEIIQNLNNESKRCFLCENSKKEMAKSSIIIYL